MLEELPGIEFHCNTVDVVNEHVAMSIQPGGFLGFGDFFSVAGIYYFKNYGWLVM